jgi:hypothetical protein
VNIFLTQNLPRRQSKASWCQSFKPWQLTDLMRASVTYRNCADSTAVVFLSIRTALMLAALRAWINALSCFFGDRPATYLNTTESETQHSCDDPVILPLHQLVKLFHVRVPFHCRFDRLGCFGVFIEGLLALSIRDRVCLVSWIAHLWWLGVRGRVEWCGGRCTGLRWEHRRSGEGRLVVVCHW